MEETNKDRIMRSILASERLAALGDYNPTDFETIEDALCSDNAIVKSVAMIIMGEKKHGNPRIQMSLIQLCRCRRRTRRK